jgi:protein phosphatase 2C family protein 2/3
VSIILNINKNGIKSTFFAVYDGHGGTGCCDFLRDYLHEYIINHQCFPVDPKKAIVEGIHRVEAKFIELAKKKFTKSGQLDRSGSCAIIVMIIGKECYTVNIGDSRAFLSKNCGKVISHLSRDHKPTDEKEQKRIISNGGKIYRT